MICGGTLRREWEPDPGMTACRTEPRGRAVDMCSGGR